ncbi:MAG: cytidine/deoxycytidylate deaminase family protein [Candidatus Kerfeldbacteria bacterium]|nr:cytidine/deoxycytidylate deaminase family protein [Candidatus Kerfeldbacteria bacterium]
MANSRPDLDQYFLNIAAVVATRATCDRAQIGAVLVKDKYIISTGYNGAPHGLSHCDDIGHLMENDHCVRTTHAEQNAIIQAAVHGSSTKDATLYCTHSPCKICVKIILNAHIKRVVAHSMYRDASVVDLFTQAGVEFVIFPAVAV